MGVRPTEHSAINNRMVRWSHSLKTNNGKKKETCQFLQLQSVHFSKSLGIGHVNKDHMIIR